MFRLLQVHTATYYNVLERTSIYLYVLVCRHFGMILCSGTCLCVVCTCMYLCVLACTATLWHVVLMIWHVYEHFSMNLYVLVHASVYWYILVYAGTY
jgi:hypothetical protein